MTVEIIEALTPEHVSIPEVEIQVLRWRPGMGMWTQCLYATDAEEQEIDAADRESRIWQRDGYHVRIITVDEKP